MPRPYDIMVAGHLCLDIIPCFPETGATAIAEIMRPGKLVNVADAAVCTGGTVLRVDLSSRKVSVEPTPDPTKWLGPRGWNMLIGWNEVKPGVGPFDPENRLVFSVGALVGTGAPTAGRMTVSSLQPRGYPEPMWASASMGGYLGAELKYAGYDGLIVQGCADAPCYLLIEDDRVSIEDASDLWGQGTFPTQKILKERHSSDHQIATIGPAGENRVRFASIIHRLSNAVGPRAVRRG